MFVGNLGFVEREWRLNMFWKARLLGEILVPGTRERAQLLLINRRMLAIKRYIGYLLRHFQVHGESVINRTLSRRPRRSTL